MDPEHSNSDKPPKPGQKNASTPSVQQPSSAPPLPSMMKSLHNPATPVDSTAQYPSLEAAVAVNQQVAPTLTNLLATDLQPAQPTALGSVALATEEIATHPTDSTIATSVTEPADVAQAQTSQAEAQASTDQAAIATTLSTPPADEAPAAPITPNNAPSSPTTNSPQLVASNIMSTPDTIATDLARHDGPSPTPGEPTEEAVAPAMAEVTSVEDLEQSVATDEQLTNPTETDQDASPSASDDVAEADEEENFDNVPPGDATRNLAQQVRIKREEDHVAIIFPQEETNANPDIAVDFIDSQIWLDLQQRLSGGTSFDNETPVHLYTQNSLWDTRQLQELDEALGRFNLTLARIITSRRQTAVAAAMSGYNADQVKHLPELLSKASDRPGSSPALAEPLYLQTTVRSGTEIRHPGSVVIVGDLNPGSSVIADGDILVWGRLRGIAHAGAAGNKQSTIMALKLEAPQLRIAGAVARVDAQGKANPTPEIAYVTPQGIRINSAYSFNRSDLSQPESTQS